MAIKIKEISKSYNGIKAIDNLSFSVNEGEIVGFLGPNGAGKSTLMKILTGYIKDFEGTALINGISIRDNLITAQKNIGYLPEHNPLYLEMYVKEYLSFNAALFSVSKNRIATVIEEVGLGDYATMKIKSLSKGYRQRVGIAAAMLHNPDVLILDEPTTGLDPNQLIEIRNLIKSLGKNKAVLFSTHIMQEVEAVCDRVIIINKGKIVLDKKLEDMLSSKEQTIHVTFDVRVEKQFIELLPNLIKADNFTDTTWELVFSTQEDMRVAVFDFAHEQGLKILNLTRKNKNLETIFQELTQ